MTPPRLPAPMTAVLFCEDIRPETQGRMSLVGVLPGQIFVDALPYVIPTLGIFVRARIRAGDFVGDTAYVRVSDSFDSGFGDTEYFDESKISRALTGMREGAIDRDHILFDGAVHFVDRIVKVPEEGDFIVTLCLGGEEQEIDRLRVRLAPPASDMA